MSTTNPLDRYQVDLDLLLAVHGGLKAALAQVHSTPGLSKAQRGRWQRRLASIGEMARADLRGAEAELVRYGERWTALTGLPAAADVRALRVRG